MLESLVRGSLKCVVRDRKLHDESIDQGTGRCPEFS